MTNCLLNEIDDAPLDGSHVMVVFTDSSEILIREAWYLSCDSGCEIGWEYTSDSGEIIGISNIIGWFSIPDFDTVASDAISNLH